MVGELVLFSIANVQGEIHPLMYWSKADFCRPGDQRVLNRCTASGGLRSFGSA